MGRWLWKADRDGYAFLVTHRAEHGAPTVQPWPALAVIMVQISGPVKANCLACCNAPVFSQTWVMLLSKSLKHLLSGAENLIHVHFLWCSDTIDFCTGCVCVPVCSMTVWTHLSVLLSLWGDFLPILKASMGYFKVETFFRVEVRPWLG